MLYRRCYDKSGNILFVQEVIAQALDDKQRPIALQHADYAINPNGRLIIKNRSGPTFRYQPALLIRHAARFARVFLGKRA